MGTATRGDAGCLRGPGGAPSDPEASRSSRSSSRAPAGDGWLGKLKAYWTDGRTWRGVAYLLARFPAGLTAFTVAVVSYGTAAMLLAAPILAASDADGMDVGPWDADTMLEGLAMVPFGALALVAAAWISAGMGSASRELARWGTR